MRAATFAFGILAATASKAQAPYWAWSFGLLGNEHVADVQAATDGDLLVAGEHGAPFGLQGNTVGWAGSTDAFVMRLTAEGGVLWSASGGGAGMDRATKVRGAADGDVYVTGQFTGAAVLFGQNVAAQGGGTDVFLARLDGADGSLQWLRTGGGAAYSEQSWALAVSPNGQVSMAGEFRGTASFGTTTVNSTFDPVAGAPGADVFIATYGSDGTFLWMQQGAAPGADRAVDAAYDTQGSLFVAGQFSGTITFDATHVSTMQGASFLVKFDASGEEQWFRMWGGAAYTHVRGLALSATGDVHLTGDLQGVMTLNDGTLHTIDAVDPQAYYLLRVSSAGSLVEAGTVGSTSAVSVASITLHADTVLVFGDFTCQFTGLSAQYGTGVFMATGTRDLFVARHRRDDHGFIRAQQFGGRSSKRAGAITTLGSGEPVLCGSFEQELVIPAPGEIGGNGEIAFSSTNGGYCGDPDYGMFMRLGSDGASDGFVAKACPPTRAPYDVWLREGPGCDRDLPEICIVMGTELEFMGHDCLDTAIYCLSPLLPQFGFIAPYASSLPYGPVAGFDLEFDWAPQPTQAWTYPLPDVPTTVTCAAQSTNGCWSWESQVVVDPLPSPTLLLSSDMEGGPLGTLIPTGPPPEMELTLCDTGWVWYHDPSMPGTVVSWSWNGQPVSNDSVWVDGPGTILIQFTAPNGCAGGQTVIFHPNTTVPLPNVTGSSGVFHAQDGSVLTGSDTIQVCTDHDGLVWGDLDVQWEIDGVVGSLPPDLVIFAISQGATASWAGHGPDMARWFRNVQDEGWYTIHTDVFAQPGPCVSDVLLGSFTTQFYLELIDPPTVITADTLIMCPGDTVAVQAFCEGCYDQIWYASQGIVGYSADSSIAYVVQPGTYYYSAYGGLPEVFCSSSSNTTVIPPIPPPLFSDPPDGFVCEGDPVTIHTTLPGTDHAWIGPDGPVPGEVPSVTVTAIGDYYLTMTDTAGCILTSGPITVAAYGTPTVQLPANGLMCPGGSITVSVAAAPGAVVQWGAPLTGTGLTQTIDVPGTYTVEVTACNATYQLDFDVALDTLHAVVDDAGPFLLCEGGEVNLSGPPGAASYLWLGHGSAGQYAAIDQAGQYQLVVTTATGCADTSAVIQVEVLPVEVPLSVSDTTVCVGGIATLLAAGSGVLTWYTDAAASIAIGEGAMVEVGPVDADTVFFVVQTHQGCTAGPLPVGVHVLPLPDAPVITGPSEVCADGTVMLTASGIGTVHWSANPGGDPVVGLGPELWFGPLIADSTIHATQDMDGCWSPVAAHVVVVRPRPATPVISGDTMACFAQPFMLEVIGTGTVVWQEPGGGVVEGAVYAGEADEATEGTYGVVVGLAGCWSDTAWVEVDVQHCALVLPNVFSPNGDGVNDVVRWISPSPSTLQVDLRNRWGQVVFSASAMVVAWDGRTRPGGEVLPEGVYFYEVSGTDGDGQPFVQGGHIQLLR